MYGYKIVDLTYPVLWLWDDHSPIEYDSNCIMGLVTSTFIWQYSETQLSGPKSVPKNQQTWFRKIQAFPTKCGLDICIFVDPKDTQLGGFKLQRHDMGMKKRPLKGGIADTPLKIGQGPGGGSGYPYTVPF